MLHRLGLFVVIVVILIQFSGSTTSDGFYYDALDPNAASPFVPSNFLKYGSGFVNTSGLILTQKGDSFGTVIFYNQPMRIGNGFSNQFVVDITNCDSNYGGADGFAFVIYAALPGDPFNVPGGSNIGVTTSSNLAVVGFILPNDILTVCAVNSSSNLGGGSLKDDTLHCLQNTTNNVLKDIRCNGTHTITISYQRPGSWEIVLDSIYTYTFEKDIVEILNWTDSSVTGYVGFSGGVGAGWMDQKIAAWTFTPYAGCLGTCDPNADCNFVNNTAICTCHNGFVGDGRTCAPILQKANIVPILECYEKFGDGAYEAYYGYNSLESGPVVIPKGVNNQFIGYNGTIDPTEYFLPGRTPFYPANAFLAELSLPNSDPITLTWHLGDYQVSFSTDDLSKRCSQDLSVLLTFTTGRRLAANETSLILDQLSTLMGISFGRISIRDVTYSPYNNKRQTSSELAELELEISSTNSTTQTEPRASQAVQQLIDASTNTTRMNEVINPDPDNQDPERTFVGVKTTPSGTETVGQVPQPMAPTSNQPTVPISATSSASSIIGNVLLVAIVQLLSKLV